MRKQAKTLKATEIRKVIDYVSTRKHAVRNKTMLLMTYYAGMRVCEVAGVKYRDVIDDAGAVRSEIRLGAAQTKGREGRTVFVNAKLRKEIQTYVCAFPPTEIDNKLFYTQKRNGEGFNRNTLTQFFHWLYKHAGVDGATSHSGRRTFITNLASQGVGVRVLMQLAGHKSINTTQAYIDVNDDMKRKAVELA